MPIKRPNVRGKPTLFYLAYLGTGVQKPDPAVVEVSSAGAAQGDLEIPVSALPVAIPKNTILEFETAAGPVSVVVTEDATAGATTLAVEAFDGADGDGIPAALTDGDEAVYDGLYTDIASQSLDFQRGATRQELNPVTHGSSTGVTMAQSEVTSIAPNIPRQGLFIPRSQIIEDIIRYGDTNANWWGRGVWPDEFGRPYIVHEGMGKVTDVSTPAPADDLIQLNYTFRFTTYNVSVVAAD